MNKNRGVAAGLFQLDFAVSLTEMMGVYIEKWELCRHDLNANFPRDTLPTFVGIPVSLLEIIAFRIFL